MTKRLFLTVAAVALMATGGAMAQTGGKTGTTVETNKPAVGSTTTGNTGVTVKPGDKMGDKKAGDMGGAARSEGTGSSGSAGTGLSTGAGGSAGTSSGVDVNGKGSAATGASRR
jgi:hypothetical protein